MSVMVLIINEDQGVRRLMRLVYGSTLIIMSI